MNRDVLRENQAERRNLPMTRAADHRGVSGLSAVTVRN
jgi:hypothetical protein